MKQIATGKRINGFWHVWVRVDGEWYGAIASDLQRAFTLAAGTIPMGQVISQVVN